MEKKLIQWLESLFFFFQTHFANLELSLSKRICSIFVTKLNFTLFYYCINSKLQENGVILINLINFRPIFQIFHIWK